MADLRPDSTGLPFIAFISQKDDARPAARVKWSPQPKVKQDEMGSCAISPFEDKAGPRLGGREENCLKRWVAMNRNVLQRYRDGEIEYTQDGLAQLDKIDGPRVDRV